MILSEKDREFLKDFLRANYNPDDITYLQGQNKTSLILIVDCIDRYIEHRIESDKVIEGLLNDIHCNLADIGTRLKRL